jgi:hypothetical protein
MPKAQGTRGQLAGRESSAAIERSEHARRARAVVLAAQRLNGSRSFYYAGDLTRAG